MFIYKGCSNPLKIVNTSNQWHSGIHSLTYHPKHKSLRALHHNNPSVTTNSLFQKKELHLNFELNGNLFENILVSQTHKLLKFTIQVSNAQFSTKYWKYIYTTCAQTKTLLQMFIIQVMHFHTHTHTCMHACAHTHTQETDLKLTLIFELCNIAEQFVCWPLVSIYISNTFSSLLLFLWAFLQHTNMVVVYCFSQKHVQYLFLLRNTTAGFKNRGFVWFEQVQSNCLSNANKCNSLSAISIWQNR